MFRELTSVFLIDSSEFAKAAPVDQTKTLLLSNGKNVLFVKSFKQLESRRAIRDNLLAGKDISVELEFNQIELSDEDRRVISLIGPILDRIGAGALYKWVSGKASKMDFGPQRINRGGYTIGLKSAKNLWDRASKAWHTDTFVPGINVQASGYNRTAEFFPDEIKIGCQSIPRVDVEAIAQHYGWEPVTE